MNHSPLWTPERQLAQTGLGELRRFELYPGMELAMTAFMGSGCNWSMNRLRMCWRSTTAARGESAGA